jgi:hypothetical protein
MLGEYFEKLVTDMQVLIITFAKKITTICNYLIIRIKM